MGTGGAILKAFSFLEEEFFILYGDSWLEINYQQVYKAFKKGNNDGLMTIYQNKGRWDKSNVCFEGNRIKFYSKTKKNINMNFIDYGLGILSKKTFSKFNKNQVFDLAIIYENLCEKGGLDHFIASKRFYEIGSKDGILEIENYFKSIR